MTWSRSRIGRACTAANPACWAAAANRGQRRASAAGSAAATGRPSPEAVQAGTLVVLQLEQLQQPGGLAGGGDHAKLPARVSQQQPGGGDVEQLHAAVGQHVQEVDHVEAGDHGVGQLNECFRQQLSVHSGSPSQETRHDSSREPGAGCARAGERASVSRLTVPGRVRVRRATQAELKLP
jgi:hypothetical protein